MCPGDTTPGSASHIYRALSTKARSSERFKSWTHPTTHTHSRALKREYNFTAQPCGSLGWHTGVFWNPFPGPRQPAQFEASRKNYIRWGTHKNPCRWGGLGQCTPGREPRREEGELCAPHAPQPPDTLSDVTFHPFPHQHATLLP